MKIPLVGGDYSALSLASQAETCINLYPELVDGGSTHGSLNPNQAGKSPGALYNCPGKHSFSALGHTNIRALYGSAGRTWTINGTDLVEVNSSGAEITRHAIPSSSGTGPASIAYNGRQVLIVDSNGKVFCDPGTGCLACTFTGSSGTVTTSNPSNGTVDTSSSGNLVQWKSGANFELGTYLVGRSIVINSVAYVIASASPPYQLTLTTNPGNQTDVDFQLQVSTVTWVSGDQFVLGGSWDNRAITINGTSKTILTVTGSTTLYTTTIISNLTGVDYSVIGDAVTATGPVVFLDGYFIIQRPVGGTPNLGRQFNISGLLDGTSWDPLDFGVKESYPDNIVGMLTANEQLYIWGSESLEAWQNTGGNVNNPFPFQRIPGSVSRFGAISPWGQVALDGNVYFFGGDGSGNGAVYALNGFTPVKVSTPSQEAAWQSQSYTNPYAYGYLEEGHSFYVLVSDTSTWGYGYDQTTGAWHARNDWSGSAFTLYSNQFHCFSNGKHLVASQASGTIYQSSISFYDDAGADRAWQRTLGYLYSENKKIIFGRFTLEMQTGTVPSGAAPNVLLSWSDNRGQSYNAGINMGAGTNNQYNIRMYVTRTGGLSGTGGITRGRNFRLFGSGQYKVALVDADCDFTVMS